MFSKESKATAAATVSNIYPIQLKKSICCRENPETATVGVLSKMACKGQHMHFPVNVAIFLRTLILKNICDRLLLNISTSVTNLPEGGNS